MSAKALIEAAEQMDWPQIQLNGVVARLASTSRKQVTSGPGLSDGRAMVIPTSTGSSPSPRCCACSLTEPDCAPLWAPPRLEKQDALLL